MKLMRNVGLFLGTLALSLAAEATEIHGRFVRLRVTVEAPQLDFEKQEFGFAAFSYLVTGLEPPYWNLLDYCRFNTEEDEDGVERWACRLDNFDIGDLIRPEEGGKNYYAFGLYKAEDLFQSEKWMCKSDGVESSVFDLRHLLINSSDWGQHPLAELKLRDCQAVLPATSGVILKNRVP